MPTSLLSCWSGWLERRQTAIYLLTLLVAAVLAWRWPPSDTLAQAINPALALMLFVTFLQLPLSRLLEALTHLRFMLALAATNFVAIPLLVALLLRLWPLESLVAVGVAIVLLCPCVDYVVTFSHQGGADSRLLLAATPLLLVLQMLLLPLWLPLLLPQTTALNIGMAPFLHAFIVLMALPLLLAAAVQRWAVRYSAGAAIAGWLGLLPVPATALVLALIIAFVVPRLGLATGAVRQALPVYLLFAVLAPALGWLMARLWSLPAPSGRALVFSGATRNALVILPLALAIPDALPVIPAVVVTQTLVELLAELVYIRWVPRLRFAGKPPHSTAPSKK
ncbi:arsenic resistance protein [Dickeya dianthicola]|uniref:bile acid:sodium symporter n=1 Tax=Dickeya dianthicola TaxID=204039 RepID=UPI000684E47E|nr:bile acid:sodium symporter [Dickeya dianthicola]MZG43123.1 arsenic resistance protein [Dickeya dianthicola]